MTGRSPISAALVAAAVLAGLAACASDETSRFGLVSDLLSSSTEDGYPRTRAEIDALPYAQLGVVLGGRRPGIAVLAEYVDDNHLWVGSDAFRLLTTPHGRVLEMTVNQTHVRTSVIGHDPLSLPPRGGESRRYLVRVQSYDRVLPPYTMADVEARTLQCTLSNAGSAAIVIKSMTIDTQKYQESCRSDSVASNATYWLDAQGRMRRVTGQFYPTGRQMRLEVLKVPQ